MGEIRRKYAVEAAHRETGESVSLTLEAANPKEARSKASDMGLLVAKTTLIKTPKPKKKPPAAQASRPAPPRPVDPHRRFYDCKVSGVTKRNGLFRGSRQAVIADCVEGENVVLVRETQNRFDTNAILVMTQSGGKAMGYIERDVAAEMAPLLDQGWLYIAQIEAIVGGYDDKPTLGVRLTIILRPVSNSGATP